VQDEAEVNTANDGAKVAGMLADAERKASQRRGEGDAIAAQIYADAY